MRVVLASRRGVKGSTSANTVETRGGMKPATTAVLAKFFGKLPPVLRSGATKLDLAVGAGSGWEKRASIHTLILSKLKSNRRDLCESRSRSEFSQKGFLLLHFDGGRVGREMFPI